MDIGSLRYAPPAPEQLSQAKKIESKPAENTEAQVSAPAPQAEQKIASKPSDPDGAGKFHAIA